MALKATLRNRNDFLEITPDELGLPRGISQNRGFHKRVLEDNFDAPDELCKIFGKKVKISFHAEFE